MTRIPDPSLISAPLPDPVETDSGWGTLSDVVTELPPVPPREEWPTYKDSLERQAHQARMPYDADDAVWLRRQHMNAVYFAEQDAKAEPTDTAKEEARRAANAAAQARWRARKRTGLDAETQALLAEIEETKMFLDSLRTQYAEICSQLSAGNVHLKKLKDQLRSR